MQKIGLIIDSHFGITQDEANSRNIGFIPMSIVIDGKSYLSGVDISAKEIEDWLLQNNKSKVMTASPSGLSIERAFDWSLQKFDKVVVITLSAKLSGTNNAVKLMAKDPKYKGKIFVYDSEYSSPWSSLLLNDIVEIVDDATDIGRIYELLDQQKGFQEGYMCPENIYWFYNGGRITKTQYIAGSIMKILPILTVKDGFIDQSSVIKIRTKKRAFKAMAQMIRVLKDEYELKNIDYEYVALVSNDKEANAESIHTLIEEFGVRKKDIRTARMGPAQVVHSGPNTLGLAIVTKFKEKK